MWHAGFYNMLFLLSVAAVFVLLPELLVGLFTDEPRVLRFGVDGLRIIIYGYGIG